MTELIKILADVDDAVEDAVEIMSEDDGTLAIETLADAFPDACGLKYTTGDNEFKRVKRAFGCLHPPRRGWGARYYEVIYKNIGRRTQCVPNTNLVVTCLPWECSNTQLRRHFEPYGNLKVCKVKKDPEDTGLCEGFGLIQYRTNTGRKRTLPKNPVVNDTKWNINVADPILTELFFAETLSTDHLTALDAVVEAVFVQHGLSDEDLTFRRRMLEKIQQYLDSINPDMQLHMYGSSLTGLGLKTSNLNILLHQPEHYSPAEILSRVFEALRTASDSIVTCVKSDFTANVPAVLFKSPCGTVDGKITVRTDSAYYSSQYLKLYANMDPRVRRLAVALRQWASVCSIDEQEKGFLPTYGFSLMTVYYLQQCQPPVLPVLAEKDHTVLMDIKNSKKHDELVKHILENLHRSAEQNVSTGTKSLVNIGRLWRGLLMFYGVKFDPETFIVCVRRLEPLSRSEKKWVGRTLAIEDPFSRRNVARTFHNEECADFLKSCLRKSSLYFSLQTNSLDRQHGTQSETTPDSSLASESSDDERVDDEEERNTCTGQAASNSSNPSDTYTYPNTFEAAPSEEDNSLSGYDADSVRSSDETEYGSQDETESDDYTGFYKYRATDESDYDEESVYSDSVDDADPSEYKYDFQHQNFRRLENPPVICIFCNDQGHYVKDCPSSVVPTTDPLPQMQPFFLEKLTSAVRVINDNEGMSHEEYSRRMHIVMDLGKFVRSCFKGAKLQLFGSSENGFGFWNSDLDISVSVKKDFDAVAGAEKLRNKLRYRRDLENVYAITNAKVPIVKFKMKGEEVEGDFSFNNDLAVRNTQLLNMYSDIDQRVRPLVLAIKWLAKICDIGDASKGTLSSYAYTLMVLHYLQHTDPPVLPVLQEIGTKTPCRATEYLVDGWDTQFYSDLKNLRRVWPAYGKNTQSEGELWLGFFRYYLEVFNFEETVVTIRVFGPLSKFEKFWNASTMAIEDPFLLSRNLAGALSRKIYILIKRRVMQCLVGGPSYETSYDKYCLSQYIRNTFALARKLYGTPFRGKKRLQKFFFDKQKLTDGDPPFVGLCHKCQKIGHASKDCQTNQRNRKGFSRR